jgi:transposase
MHRRGGGVSLAVMKAYSGDLRERTVRELEAHVETQPETAERFAVSLSCVEKVRRRWRETGRCAARPHAGGRQRSLRGAGALVRAEVAGDPDLTLAALCRRAGHAGGPRASQRTMCVELRRLKLPLKKSPSVPVGGRRRG